MSCKSFEAINKRYIGENCFNFERENSSLQMSRLRIELAQKNFSPKRFTIYSIVWKFTIGEIINFVQEIIKRLFISISF